MSNAIDVHPSSSIQAYGLPMNLDTLRQRIRAADERKKLKLAEEENDEYDLRRSRAADEKRRADEEE